MKLLLCAACGDVFSLSEKPRECECGQTSGAYEEDGLHAWYFGSGIPLGFSNPSFHHALANQPEGPGGAGQPFMAFVIPRECDTFEKRQPK